MQLIPHYLSRSVIGIPSISDFLSLISIPERNRGTRQARRSRYHEPYRPFKLVALGLMNVSVALFLSFYFILFFVCSFFPSHDLNSFFFSSRLGFLLVICSSFFFFFICFFFPPSLCFHLCKSFSLSFLFLFRSACHFFLFSGERERKRIKGIRERGERRGRKKRGKRRGGRKAKTERILRRARE